MKADTIKGAVGLIVIISVVTLVVYSLFFQETPVQKLDKSLRAIRFEAIEDEQLKREVEDFIKEWGKTH